MDNCISLAEVFADLPKIILRERVSELTGGLIASKTMANNDSRGTGPARRVRLGRRIGYLKEDFLDWLEHRNEAGGA